MNRKPVIGIIGGGSCTPEIADLATAVGREVAARGAVVLCGGLGGVMEAACRGAKEEGGLTIGVLPGESRDDANAFVDIALATGLRDARNVIIARSCDAVIAIDGQYGTLSEIAFCLKFDVPVVGLSTWRVDPRVLAVETAAEAVERAMRQARG